MFSRIPNLLDLHEYKDSSATKMSSKKRKANDHEGTYILNTGKNVSACKFCQFSLSLI